MAFRMRDEPDCKGRCACSQTASHSAIASITGRRKSFGWALALRRQLAGEGPVLQAEFPACDAEPAGAQPLAEMRDRARSERHVYVRVEVEEPLALRLRVTPSDGDDFVRVASLDRCGLREMRCELLIGLLANRARVEDEHVVLVLRRRLAETELLEHALDPLAVVSVHLAAER